MAVNCCMLPGKLDGLAGVTAIETRAGPPTASVVEPLMELDVAEMVVMPVPTPVARPWPPIVATAAADELQVAAFVKTRVVPSV